MNLTPKQQTAIKMAIERGNNKYWDDTEKQVIEEKEWAEKGCPGDRPEIMKGSLIDYINEEVTKETESW